MNISTALAAALVLGCGAASAGAAGTARERAQEGREMRLNVPHREKGFVVAVDAAKAKLRVKDHFGQERGFSTRKAKINTVEGKTISLADISIGDEVSVTYKNSYKGREAIAVLRILHKRAKK